LDRARRDAGGVPERPLVIGSTSSDEVRYFMTCRFAVATHGTGVQELLYLLNAAADPFLVVLDRQWRPRGIVCALDVLVAESNCARAEGELVTTDWRPLAARTCNHARRARPVLFGKGSPASA
jgi:hypothetical protein